MKSVLTLLLAVAFGAAHAVPSTSSLDGWTTWGDIVSQSDAIVLTTAVDIDGDTDQPFNLSGTSAVDVALLESGAGVAPYALDLPSGEYATEGSLVQQSFVVLSGQTLSFSWTFTTAETQFDDHAFVVIDGQVFTLATRTAAAPQPFSFAFGHDGLVSLAFGVADTVDVVGVSSLGVHDLQLSPVPEPAAPLLLLAGLGGIALARRRRDVTI